MWTLFKDRKSKQAAVLEELAKEDLQVLALAYTYAKNLQTYGVDVTEKWLTATQNASALEKAYLEGYYDAMEQANQAFKASEFLRVCSESEDKE